MKYGLLLLLALVATPACTPSRMRHYLDPAQETMQYEDLSKSEAPLLLKLSVRQTTSNRALPPPPDNESSLREAVARVFRKSGLIKSSYEGKDGGFTVTLEHTRLTYEDQGPGAHGRSDYELTASINTGGRTATRKYEHAEIWYLGNAREPEGLVEPIDESIGTLDAMIEQLVLRALRDFQEEGVIPKAVN